MTETKYNERLVLWWIQSGYTTSDIAGKLKVSRQRASIIIHKCGIKPMSHPPILRKGESSKLWYK